MVKTPTVKGIHALHTAVDKLPAMRAAGNAAAHVSGDQTAPFVLASIGIAALANLRTGTGVPLHTIVVGGFTLMFAMSLLSSVLPAAAHSLAALILMTALLTKGLAAFGKPKDKPVPATAVAVN